MARVYFFLHIPHIFAGAARQVDPTLAVKDFLLVSSQSGRPTVVDYSESLRGWSLASRAARPCIPGERIRRGALLDKLKLRKDILIFPADYQAARDFHFRILQALDAYSPLAASEKFGQFVFDMSGTEKIFGHPLAVGTRLVGEIRESFGVSSKVGVGSTLLVAALAGLSAAPDTTVQVWNAERAFIGEAPIHTLPGLSEETKLKLLKDFNLRQAKELTDWSREDLISSLGHEGKHLHDLLTNRLPNLIRKTVRDAWASSSGSERPARKKTVEKEAPVGEHDALHARKIFDQTLSELAAEMRRQRLFPRRYRLVVTYGDDRREETAKALALSNHYAARLRRELAPVFEKTLERRVYLKKFLLSFFDFAPPEFQIDVFGDLCREDRLAKAYDALRGRYGKVSLQHGFEIS